MPATALRCRICTTEHELEAVGTCPRCFAPLDPVYDWDEVERDVHARGDRRRARVDLALRAAAAGRAPAAPRLAPGLTPLVAAPRLAEQLGIGELWLKLDTANPTHSFKDRVVAVAAAKAQELGLTTLACSSTGNLAGAVAARAAAEGLDAAVFCPVDLEPEKLLSAAVYGPTIYAVRGNYDHCSRLTVELSFELDWAFVNVTLRAYYAEGSKTLAYEVAEQLGWELPDVVVAPIASGRDVLEGRAGLRRAAPARARRRRAAAAARRPGRGLLAGRDARSRTASASSRCGPTRSRARSRSATRPTATSRSRPRARPAARSTPCPRTTSAANIVLLAETTGVFGETAPAVTLGALREAVAAGRVGAGGPRRPARHRRRPEDAGARRLAPAADRDRAGRRRAAGHVCSPRPELNTWRFGSCFTFDSVRPWQPRPTPPGTSSSSATRSSGSSRRRARSASSASSRR